MRSRFLSVLLALFATANLWAAKIPVGVVLPMTGPTATFGQESYNGMLLALKMVNKQGIKGNTIDLVSEDNKGEPIDTANAIRKLIKIDKVVTLLGAVASSNTLAGAPIAQSSKVPLLTPASTNERVTQVGEFVGRICFTDNFQGEVMAKFAYNSLGKRKAAVIVDQSSDYSKGLSEVFKKKFKSLGGKVIEEEFAYQQKDLEFKSLLVKLRRDRPDVIYLPGYYSEVGLILKQARQMRIDAPILGGDGWDSATLHQLAGKKGVKDTFISSHFAPDDTDKMVQEFVKSYRQEFKARPGAMAALGYDALLVLADAIKRSKTLGPDHIKQAINATKSFRGVTGEITIDKNRNAVKSAVVLELTQTGYKFKERIRP